MAVNRCENDQQQQLDGFRVQHLSSLLVLVPEVRQLRRSRLHALMKPQGTYALHMSR